RTAEPAEAGQRGRTGWLRGWHMCGRLGARGSAWSQVASRAAWRPRRRPRRERRGRQGIVSINRERGGRELLEVEVLRLLDRDADELNLSSRKCARGFVLFADRITTVAPDTQAIARQRELAKLRPHVALRHDLVVDVERRRADRLLIR